MRIIKLGKSKEIQQKCPDCYTLFGFLEHEILEKEGSWVRTGVESSEREIKEYVKCPACNCAIVLNKYKQTF
jgi:hypothetical protein